MPVPEILSRSVEKYGLGYIRPRHNEIARRLVSGQKPIDVQRVMGFSESRFSIIINSPLFKVVLAKLSKLRDENAVDIQEELKEIVPIVLGECTRIAMTSTSEKLRLSASQDLLDRGGVVKKTTSPGLGVQINIHPVDLEKFRGDGVTIDVTKEPDNGSDVQPVNKSKSNGDEKLAEDMKLLDEVLPVEEDNADTSG